MGHLFLAKGRSKWRQNVSYVIHVEGCNQIYIYLWSHIHVHTIHICVVRFVSYYISQMYISSNKCIYVYIFIFTFPILYVCYLHIMQVGGISIPPKVESLSVQHSIPSIYICLQHIYIYIFLHYHVQGSTIIFLSFLTLYIQLIYVYTSPMSIYIAFFINFTRNVLHIYICTKLFHHVMSHGYVFLK